MALQADSDGFLVGTPIKVSKTVSDALKLLQGLKADTYAIRQHLAGVPIQPRDKKGRYLPMPQAAPASAQAARTTSTGAKGAPAAKTTAKPAVGPSVAMGKERDGSGRFVSTKPVAEPKARPAKTTAPAKVTVSPVAEPRKINIVMPSNSGVLTEGRMAGVTQDEWLRSRAEAQAATAARMAQRQEEKRALEEYNRAHGKTVEPKPIAPAQPQDGGKTPSPAQPTPKVPKHPKEPAEPSRGHNHLGSSLQRILQGAQGVDPTLKALSELSMVLAAVTGPFKALFKMTLGRDRQSQRNHTESVGWFKKIWRQLVINGDEQPAGHGGGGGEGGGLFGDAFKIKGGFLGRMLSLVTGASLMRSFLKGGRLGKAGEFLRGLGNSKIFRRVPLLGSLIAGGSALYSMFGPDDPHKNAAQNRHDRFVNGGAGVGGMIGAGLGTFLDPFIGPLGTILGGIIGDKVGGVIGNILSTFDWDKITDKTKKALDKAGDKVNKAIDTAGTALSAGSEGLKAMLGLRHKAQFSGFKGAEGMSRLGSYTSDEANMLNALMKTGANTSANVKGGMSASIKQKIIDAAVKAGLSPKTMLEMVSMESGGNPNAISGTGAIGLGQFTGSTATGLGIKNRFDIDQNINGIMMLAKGNIAALKKNGLPITPENIYMAHQLGPSAAVEVIKGAASGKKITELSQRAQDAIMLNFGKNSRTAQEYLSKNAAAMVARYNSVVDVSAPLGTPSVSAAPPVAKMEPPAAPNIPSANGADRRDTNTVVGVLPPPSQNLKDRALSQIATGGMGAGM